MNPAPSVSNFPPAKQANFALALLLLAYIFSFIDRQILSLLVEPMKQDLQISDFQVSLLQGMAFALFYTFMGLPIAWLADHSSRRRIIAVGITLWSVMTCFCGLAKSYSSLFMARVGVGVGEAALSPAAYSMLSDYYPPARLPRAMAIFTMGITLGGGMAYLIGGTVIALVADADTITLPLIGNIRPWQATFIAVGLPGLLVALLMLSIKEPARQITASHAEADKVSMSATLQFVIRHKRGLGAHFVGVSLLSIFGYGLMSWYPTLFVRNYGVSIAEVGQRFGLIYLVFGSLGALAGAWCAQSLAGRGHSDANLRWVMWSALLVAIPAAIAPLLPSAMLLYWFAIPLVLLQNSYFGVAIAALQLATPNRMRASVSALLLFMTNLLGLGLGPSLVAALTDFVFQDPQALRYSLSIVAIIVCPLAALVLAMGLKHYRAMLQALVD
ncbi:MAG: spinster family MFS transporter [Pseudomonadales bacterium]